MLIAGEVKVTYPVKIMTNDEVIKSLKCFHGCDDDIAGVFYFENGCVCNSTKIQALCYYHMMRADSNRDSETTPMEMIVGFE